MLAEGNISPSSLARLESRGRESMSRRRRSDASIQPTPPPTAPTPEIPEDMKLFTAEIVASNEDVAGIERNDLKYIIQLRYGSIMKWQVERSYDAIIYLSTELLNIYQNNQQTPLPTLSPHDQFSTEDFDKFFREVIYYFGDLIWKQPLILSFFDDYANNSFTSAIRIMRLEEQIEMLQATNVNLHAKMSETESLTLAVYDIMRILQGRVNELEKVPENPESSEPSPSRASTQSRASIVREELETALRTMNDGEMAMRNLRNSYYAEDSSENSSTAVSVRTSVESQIRSWPRPRASVTTSIRSNIEHEIQVPSEEVSESPASHSSEGKNISPRYFADLDSTGSSVTTSVTPSAAPTPSAINSRKKVYEFGSNQEDWNDENLDERGDTGYFSQDQKIQEQRSPCAMSKLNSNATTGDFDHEDADNELSLLASALAAAPKAKVPTVSSLTSVWSNIASDEKHSYFLDATFDNSGSTLLPSSLDTKRSQLPWNLVPSNDSMNPCDEVIEELLTIIRPHEPQLVYRSSANSFLAKQVRRALGARIFEIGLHSLRCFLPDDPMRFSVTLWKNHSGHWHTHLSDRLCRLSEQGKIAEDEIIDQNYDDIPSHMDHTICNVSYTNSSTNSNDFRIFCMLDSLSVEIASNCRMELCLLSFFEEISALVGKNNLYKRSILLIRAWWVYETNNYIGSPIKHYLPDFAILVMITAIFNKYHDRIFYPMQALCLFLSEYAEVDWTNSAITVQSITTFKSNTDNQPIPTAVEPNHLIQAPLLDKYWDIVNLPADTAAEVVTETHSTRQDTEVVATAAERAAGETARDVSLSVLIDDGPKAGELLSADAETNPDNDNDVKSHPLVTGSVISVQVLNAEKISAGRKAALETFERRAFNIINPLTNTNMMNDKLNVRRAKRIGKAFSVGAKNMQAVLKLSSSTGVVSVQTAIKNFFRTTFTRYSSGWRPDVIGNTIWVKTGPNDPNDIHSQSWADNWCDASRGLGVDKVDDDIRDADSELSDVSRDLMRISTDKLWDDILYCSLVLEGKISETALLILTKEILMERGTLPVGEIGKMLQELTSMTTLSSKLKEKFGGLKKFLERFSEHFIIGSDHPFNPHVYLRQTLTSEDFDTISRGSVPPHLLAKFKKMVVVRKKKVNPLPPPPSNVDFGPWTGNAQSFMGIAQVPSHPFNPPPVSAPVPQPPTPTSSNKRVNSTGKQSNLVPPVPQEVNLNPNLNLASHTGQSFPQDHRDSNKFSSYPAHHMHHMEAINSNIGTRLGMQMDSLLNNLSRTSHDPPVRDAIYHSYPSRKKSILGDDNHLISQVPGSIGLNPNSFSLQNPHHMEHSMSHQYDEWNMNGNRGGSVSQGPTPTPPGRVRSIPRSIYQQQVTPPFHGNLSQSSSHFDSSQQHFLYGQNQGIGGNSHMDVNRDMNRDIRDVNRDMSRDVPRYGHTSQFHHHPYSLTHSKYHH